MKEFNPTRLGQPELANLLTHAILPRPIALASTISTEGKPNLAPFSYFNVFSSNPPILVFSPSRRGRDLTTKHTHDNLKEVPEVVINMVNYAMVEQMNLTSADYPAGVNEFIKAGFHPLPSKTVKPFRVEESPVQFECRVKEIIETGEKGGSGNLVICEVSYVHVDEKILDEKGLIDPHKADMVGRLGGHEYVRASGAAVFTVKKPGPVPGIGIDALPEHVRNSSILTGNDLGRLGMLERLPSREDIQHSAIERMVDSLRILAGQDADRYEELVHQLARDLIAEGRTEDALRVLMAD